MKKDEKKVELKDNEIIQDGRSQFILNETDTEAIIKTITKVNYFDFLMTCCSKLIKKFDTSYPYETDIEKTVKQYVKEEDIIKFITNNNDNAFYCYFFNIVNTTNIINFYKDNSDIDKTLFNNIKKIVLDGTIKLVTKIIKFTIIHKYNNPETLRSGLFNLMNDTDIDGTITYFDCITDFICNLKDQNIIKCSMLKDKPVEKGVTLTQFNKNNIEFEFKKFYKFDGRKKKKQRKIIENYPLRLYAFSSLNNPLFKKYPDGVMFSPCNPCTKFRDTDDFYYIKIDEFTKNRKDFYNTYTPPFTSTRDVKKECFNDVIELYVILQEVIACCCGYNKDYIEFFNDYIAQLVQRPYEQMDYMIFMCSLQKGIGKTKLLGEVLRALLKYVVFIKDDCGNIVGNFNEDIAYNVLQIRDENSDDETKTNIFIKSFSDNLERMKSLHTLTVDLVGNKNVKNYLARIYVHILIFANTYEIFKPQIAERRQVLIKGLSNLEEARTFYTNESPERTIKFYSVNNVTYRPEEYKTTEEYKLKVIQKWFDVWDRKENTKNELMQFIFNEYTKRPISPTFAHDYLKYPMFTEMNERMMAEAVIDRADITYRALLYMFSDLKNIISGRLNSANTDLTPRRYEDLTKHKLKLIKETYQSVNGKEIQNYIQILENQYNQVKVYELLGFYIENELEKDPTYKDNKMFKSLFSNSFGESKATLGVKQLGLFIKELSQKRPELLDCKQINKADGTRYRYKLNVSKVYELLKDIDE